MCWAGHTPKTDVSDFGYRPVHSGDWPIGPHCHWMQGSWARKTERCVGIIMCVGLSLYTPYLCSASGSTGAVHVR